MAPRSLSRRAFLTGATAATTTALAGCVGRGSPYSPGDDADSEWPTPGYDVGSSAANPDAAAPRNGVTERWSVEVPTPSGRPVVASGTVLVPTVAELVALDLATGEVRWRFGTDQPWPVSPAVHDGTAYLGFSDRTGLVALDVADGSVRWETDTQGALRASPTFDRGRDRLFYGDDTGRVGRVDLADGTVRSTAEVIGVVGALAYHTSLLVGTRGGEVYDFHDDREVLIPLWRRKVDGAVTDLAFVDGTAFVATFGGPVYRLEDGAHAGSSRWEYDRGAIHLAATSGDVFGTDGGGLRALDGRTGSERWAIDGSFDCPPAVAGDTVYVGSRGDGGGSVAAYALDGGTGVSDLRFGARRWRYPVDGAVRRGVAVADGAVFAVTQGSEGTPARVYALDPA